MEGEFKQCTNGHWYFAHLEKCPYCIKRNNNAGSSTSLKTDVFPGGGENSQLSTEVQDNGNNEAQTTLVGSRETVTGSKGGNATPFPNRTVFEETEIEETPKGKVEKKIIRNSRKLVGWLVTYSFDAMGVDYKLYEGRNVIGHDVDCNITVNDPVMSGKHATILFQDNVYFLKDEFSTHGTFVNDEKMYPNSSQEIKDGDIIRLGKTTFKFRTSL